MAARASTPESDGRSKGENRNGAQGRDRTTDTAIFNRMLYQLSYLALRGITSISRTLFAAQTELALYQSSGGTWGSMWVLNGVGGAWVHAAFAPTGYLAVGVN